MSRWFRMYDCVLDDPKVQRLSPSLFKLWVNCLCAASKNGGKLPSAPDLAFLLRCDADKLAICLRELDEAGLLDRDETGISPHNWGNRQFQSDDVNKRVKRFRNRKRNVSETPDETPPETETETETEKIRDADASLVNEAVDAPVKNVKSKDEVKPALRLFGERWNELAGSLRLPEIEEIKSGSTRERHALARLREIGPDPEAAIAGLMAKIRGSPYLRGEVNGFRCSFDWMVNASNFQKIMEGNYEDRKVTSIKR